MKKNGVRFASRGTKSKPDPVFVQGAFTQAGPIADVFTRTSKR